MERLLGYRLLKVGSSIIHKNKMLHYEVSIGPVLLCNSDKSAKKLTLHAVQYVDQSLYSCHR